MIYIGRTRLRRLDDGSSSLFVFVSGAPRFDEVAAVIDRPNGAQARSRVVARAGGEAAK